jgi:AraC family transcriptional regulator of adaptative response / DNA-3-methyladenine glycosylase II
MSARQLRRIIQREFGVTPVQLAQTNRLLLAKQLLAETNIPMIDVAWSSGFDSVRRFNTAIKTRYGFTPSEMRRLRKDKANDDHIELAIGYRPPYAWCELIGFLQPRLTQGVEAIVAGSYVRSVQINKCRGWFRVSQNPDKHILKLMVSIDLLPVMSSLLSQVRRMFDVSARPDVISDHLAQDKQLAALVRQHPGLRVPGTVNGLELIIRAILGQQITVKAATTLASRLAIKFSRSVKTSFDEINRLSPTARRLAKAVPTELGALGILESRANTILAVARGFSQRELTLASGDFEQIVEQLKSYRSIGDWTAQYVAMRSLQ